MWQQSNRINGSACELGANFLLDKLKEVNRLLELITEEEKEEIKNIQYLDSIVTSRKVMKNVIKNKDSYY